MHLKAISGIFNFTSFFLKGDLEQRAIVPNILWTIHVETKVLTASPGIVLDFVDASTSYNVIWLPRLIIS